MPIKKAFLLAAVLFMALSPAITAATLAAAGTGSPLATPLPSAKTPNVNESFGWEVRNARVVDEGNTIQTQEGALTTGYTIEASAVARGKAPFSEGKFRVTLTIFSPSRDMPGQKAGMWYVRGDWSITDENASPEVKKMRHSAARVKGTLVSKLEFNPAIDEGIVHAGLRAPRLANARRGGQGTFQGNQKFEGRMEITLKR